MSVPVSTEMVAEIQASLSQIETEEGAKILLAIESGSRAWGFHSPDSDYDVRFIYVRGVDWHLSVEPGRDVIERPIDDELDLSGWDLRKTLELILRSNAVALEWLGSPITYAGAPGFREELLDFARRTLRRKPVMWHYLRLAERQQERLRGPDGQVRLKRYFYVIRPVLALRWLRLQEDLAAPPMDMATLLAESAPPDDAHAEILVLTRQKMSVGEMGTAAATPDGIDALIAEELDAARMSLGNTPPEPRAKSLAEADALLCKWVRRMDLTIPET